MKSLLLVILFIFLSGSFVGLQAQTIPVNQWDKTFGGSTREEIFAAQQTSDGGYVLGGYSYSGISGDKTETTKGLNSDYWIVKIDASGNKQWDKTIGGCSGDVSRAIIQTPDGGYLIGGSSHSAICGDKTQAPFPNTYDYWVVKLDANGNKQWDKTFGGNQDDMFMALQQTSDGGYILAGYSYSGISGAKTEANRGFSNSADCWLVKIDVNGNKQWDKTIGSSGMENLMEIRQTTDGGFILGSDSSGPVSFEKSQPNRGSVSTSDFWLVKLSANGTKQWDKTFGGSGDESIYSIDLTLDGGYILGGASKSPVSGEKSQPSLGDYDGWVVKTDGSGNLTWEKNLGGSGTERINSIKQAADGGYIFGGYTSSSQNGDITHVSKGLYDYWLVKLSGTGTKVWDYLFGGTDYDYLNCLSKTADGGYLLAGHTRSGAGLDKTQPSRGDYDYWIIKMSPDVLDVKESEAAAGFNLSPNPNTGSFNLTVTNVDQPEVEVQVADLLGRIILQQKFKTHGSQFSRQFSLPAVRGMYQVQVKISDKVTIRKIMVE